MSSEPPPSTRLRTRHAGCLNLFLGVAVLALGGPDAPGELLWQSGPGHRRAALPLRPARNTQAPFLAELNAAALGIQFTNHLASERSLTNQVFLNGSGVAAGDVDGDGLCDLYFCGLDTPNVLYRNLGNWRFAIAPSSTAVACADQPSTGAAFADVDGDGDLDLLVSGIASGVRLFMNDGRGGFRETTEAAGLRGKSCGTTIALGDVDGDGLPDLYLVNYRSDTMRDMPAMEFTVGVSNGVRQILSVDGRPASHSDLEGRFVLDATGGILEQGEPDGLYRNLGSGRFALQSWTDGRFRDESGAPATPPRDWGLTAMFRDLNGDGAPDLYVCNDFQSPDRIWINNGTGQFTALPREALRSTSLFSMGVDFADLDRDGHDEFFVADMLSRDHARRQVQVMDANAFAQFRAATSLRPQVPRNTLFHHRGDGTYAEIAWLSGVAASEWTWSPAFLDVDLDGYEDLLVTTGHERDAMHADIAAEIEATLRRRPLPPREQLRLRRRFPRLDTPNLVFRNRGDLTLAETGRSWGFDSRRVSHGMAFADLDNDGDLDVVINCLNDAPLLYRNQADAPRLAVRLRGQLPNTRGIGARITVAIPGHPPQSQEMIAGGRYLSCDEGLRVFAAHSPSLRSRVTVRWRSGRETILDDLRADHIVEIDEPPGGSSASATKPALPSPLFIDVSERLGHTHRDESFDDFALQPLLPWKLSDLGPGIAWFDFNQDGWEDLIIGGGKGGRLGVYRNDGRGGFVPQRSRVLEAALDRDLTAVLGWRASPTNASLLLGLAGYETFETNSPALRQVSLTTGIVTEDLLRSEASSGPLALGDIDGDGDLDVFVGGRVRAGRYPSAVSSSILRDQGGGRLVLDAGTSRALADVGLVCDALFTELGDAPGTAAVPELVVACEWGPVRIFRWNGSSLSEWIPEVLWNDRRIPLSALTGWWNSVATGDFDNDGRMDLVAGNLGRNTARQAYQAKPIRLGYADVDGSSRFALLEMHTDPALNAVVPARDLGMLSRSFPVFAQWFPTHAAFGKATVGDLRKAGLSLDEVQAATGDSVVLLNRGDRFEATPLPMEAQVAPVFGIGVADFDGDGDHDLLLAQNLSGVGTADTAYNAGRGVLFSGDGTGRFTEMNATLSGIRIPGDGRGVAVADFDHDGRADVAITQHGDATRLYRNTGARRGVRVRLTGPTQNPAAIGARVRLHYADGRHGPLHEIRLGGGYWSQDGQVMVLGRPVAAKEVEIRWPGGRSERVPVAEGVEELSSSAR